MRVTIGKLALLGAVSAVAWAAHEVAGEAGGAAVAEVPGVSQTAVDAYTNAAADMPASCGLSWQLVAAIGAVETGHGTFGDSELNAAGVATPPIRGPRLDGVEFALILDTDDGALDGDTVYDRAVGPMQFIPATWRQYGTGDPQDIHNAARATAKLLCAVAEREGRQLTDPAVEEAAIRAYNNSAEYVTAVRGFRDDFRTVATELRGEGVTPSAVATKLGVEGRRRWERLGVEIARAPGAALDRAYGAVDPAAELMWTTLDRDGLGNAAALSASSAAGSIVKAAEAWVGRDYRPGVGEQCAFFVRQVLADAGVQLVPEVTLQPLDQWSSPGPGVANSFGGDQGLVVKRVEDLQPGDVVMFANTYGSWPAGSITHVGIVVEVNGPTAEEVVIVDRPTKSAPVQRRPLSTFEHFSGGVRL